MITSFADRATECLFRWHPVRRFSAELQRVMLRKLVQLDAVTGLDELRVPHAIASRSRQGIGQGNTASA